MPMSPTRGIRTFRYAVFFDGIDDYGAIPHSDRLVPRDEFTVMGWFNYGGMKEHGSIVGKSIRPANYTYWVYVSPDQRLCVTFYSTSIPSLCSRAVLSMFRWYSFAVTWSYPGELRLFIDSMLDNSTASLKEPIDTGGFVTIAELRPGRFMLLRGWIASLLLYERALSPNEILHNHQCPEDPVRNGLVLWLHAHPDYIKDIDGDGVLEWIDLSGNNNHAKLYGATLATPIKTPLR